MKRKVATLLLLIPPTELETGDRFVSCQWKLVSEAGRLLGGRKGKNKTKLKKKKSLHRFSRRRILLQRLGLHLSAPFSL